MSDSVPILGYHDLRGVVYPIKFQLAYLGIDYYNKQYPLTAEGLDEWFNEKPHLGLDFPNLPYWKDGNTELTESKAIMKHNAREKKGGVLMPKNPELVAKAEMVENVIWDTWLLLAWRTFHNNEACIEMLETRAPPKFEQLNNYIWGKKMDPWR